MRIAHEGKGEIEIMVYSLTLCSMQPIGILKLLVRAFSRSPFSITISDLFQKRI